MLRAVGSTDILIYGPSCSAANCIGSKYLPAQSSTANQSSCALPLHCSRCTANGCGFVNNYTDGSSASGSVYKDMITMGNLRGSSAYFGAISSANGAAGAQSPFYTNSTISGIFGLMNSSRQSSFGIGSQIFSLLSANSLPNTFTLCLQSGGGSLILGEDFSGNNTFYSWVPTAETGKGYYEGNDR